MLAKANIKEITIKAVVKNPDGTVKEDLGNILYYHKNPLMRLLYRILRRK